MSGGADSVALALLLQEQGCEIIALHCNFHLRGEESVRDEDFVRDFCRRHAIPLHVKHFDTTAYAEAHKLSIEMAARELRYAWFEEMREQLGVDHIAVGHHRDDQAETVLLNLIRGTGIKGLSGIAPQNGHIIRPLLDTPREDILDYLKSRGETYVTDSSNGDTAFRRNKIRHEALPLLREINPSISATLADTARRMRDTRTLVQFALEHLLPKAVCAKYTNGFDISIEVLKQLPAPETLLFELLSPCGFSTATCSELFAALSTAEIGKLFKSASHICIVGRGILEVMENCTPDKSFSTFILHEGSNPLPDGTCLILQKIQREDLKKIPRSAHTACLDADLITAPLTLRPTAKGDRFIPFGMKGNKLVSDYFSDRKASFRRRLSAKVVCLSSEAHPRKSEIVWLVGERPSNLYTITERTQSVLMITLQA